MIVHDLKALFAGCCERELKVAKVDTIENLAKAQRLVENAA